MPTATIETEKGTADSLQGIVQPQRRDSKKKFEKHPSCFGKLDCRGIYAVAVKHGMEVIQCRKGDMMCFNDVGLYGTTSQMKAVEAEWTANGNEPKPRSFKAVFGVNLDLPREQWASVAIAEAKKHAISNEGGTLKCQSRNGDNVTAPPGYRLLAENELPRKSDIAWNSGAQIFEPVDMEGVKHHGEKFFKEHVALLLRLNTKLKRGGD